LNEKRGKKYGRPLQGKRGAANWGKRTGGRQRREDVLSY